MIWPWQSHVRYNTKSKSDKIKPNKFYLIEIKISVLQKIPTGKWKDKPWTERNVCKLCVWCRIRIQTIWRILTYIFFYVGKAMATHSSVLAWRIPGTAEPGGLPSMGSHRVRHDWSDLAGKAEAKKEAINLMEDEENLQWFRRSWKPSWGVGTTMALRLPFSFLPSALPQGNKESNSTCLLRTRSCTLKGCLRPVHF